MKKIALIAFPLIVVFVVVGIWLKAQIKIDSCLDDGGRWNYEQEKCEYK